MPYPYQNVFEAFLIGDYSGLEPRPAAEPTRALPGSLDKLRTIADRVRRGEAAFHPEDGPQDEE